MSKLRPIRMTLPKEDAELLKQVVRRAGSSETRILRLALKLYLALRQRGVDLEATFFYRLPGDEYEVIELIMPWDRDWDGLPEKIDPGDVSTKKEGT